MKEKLTPLYETLAMIETKGNNTILLGQCLQYLKNLIDELDVPAEDTNND